jgi:hypothetical protein
MSMIKDHHCFKCGVELTSPSPVENWSHGTSINGGMTVEFRGGVGSEFDGYTFVGVVCDVCARDLASQVGRMTATYPMNREMPVGTALIDGNRQPEPAAPVPPAEEPAP